MPLGPGAEVLDDFRSAEDTSAGRTGGTSLNAGRISGGGGEGLGGKKCCRSVLLISVGEEAFSSVETDQGLCRLQSFWHPRLIARQHWPETATSGFFWQIG